MDLRLTGRNVVVTGGSKGIGLAVAQAFAAEVVPLFASGLLRPNIDSRFKMAEIAQAHARLFVAILVQRHAGLQSDIGESAVMVVFQQQTRAGIASDVDIGPPVIIEIEKRISLAQAEIAATLGINVGTVKSRIARARESLRCLLAEACPEFSPEAEPSEWFEPVRAAGRLALACA